MNKVKIAGLSLIMCGILGLVYHSFDYIQNTHEATLGPIEISVNEKRTVDIPVWAGVGCVVIGGMLLLG
jgi:hypothetical protein